MKYCIAGAALPLFHRARIDGRKTVTDKSTKATPGQYIDKEFWIALQYNPALMTTRSSAHFSIVP